MPSSSDIARRAGAFARTYLRVVGLALPLLVGCDGSSSLGPASDISVVNLTADTIAVQLWERESSYLVDPMPERPASSEGDRIVYPRGRRVVPTADIPAYQAGKDVVVFVYRIRGTRSAFAALERVSAVRLRQRGYVLEIPASTFREP
jgi:hypothetical protein